jgi:Kef-type K+ transport system membrane component KefB
MELHEFFLLLAIVLLGARLFSEAASRVGIPAVIGELAAGVILGPSLLGWVSPSATLEILAEIGIVLLLFEVGMDTDVYRLARTGAKPFIVALVGFVLPFVLGSAISLYGFGLPLIVSLFIGGTLTATSIGITVRVLTELRRRSSDEAQIVIGAAVLDDILGVIALAFLYQFAVIGEATLASVGGVSLYMVLFVVLAPVAAKIVAWVIDHFDRKSASPGLLVVMVVSLIMLFSYLAHLVGAPLILGGFAAGIAMGHRFQLSVAQRLGLPFATALNRALAAAPHLAERLEQQLRPLIQVFTPIFFVMVGVSLNLSAVDWGSGFVWELGGALLVIAVAGKWVAGYCIREPRLRQTVIGLSMVPRGEVGLIFAQVGLVNGILNAEAYAALLVVIALTTALPPFALKWTYARWGGKAELSGQEAGRWAPD